MAERAVGAVPQGLDTANPGFDVPGVLERIRLPSPKTIGKLVKAGVVAGGAVLGALGMSAANDSEPSARVDISQHTADRNLALAEEAQDGLTLVYGEGCPEAWDSYSDGGRFGRDLGVEEREEKFVADSPAACTVDGSEATAPEDVREIFWAFNEADDLVEANKETVEDVEKAIASAEEDEGIDLPFNLDRLEAGLSAIGLGFILASGKAAKEAEAKTAESNANRVENTLTRTIQTTGIEVGLATERIVTTPDGPDARAAARALMENTAGIPNPVTRAA